MKVVFLSNYYNHHQNELSAYMSEKSENYHFISTGKMREDRKLLGYGEINKPDYVIEYNENTKKTIKELIAESDVIIHGGIQKNTLQRIKHSSKTIFCYSERPLKKGDSVIKYIPRYVLLQLYKWKYHGDYLLCAGAFTSYDYSKFGMYKNKAYKWGYFPETKNYNLETLLNDKIQNRILWCGRFLDWKHPDDVIEIAQKLREEQYEFEIYMIGNGVMENRLKDLVLERKLNNYVKFLGSMNPERVRKMMERAGIYLFTSDRREGWGAVLNEAMNAGCAVVASHAIGSVPFMLKDNVNGRIYKSRDILSLYEKVKYLLDNPSEQRRLGENAYLTITTEWNASIAVERLVEFYKCRSNGKNVSELYESGPCSKAEIIKDDWFDE